MSFKKRFVSLMTQPGEDSESKDNIPCCSKYTGRAFVVAGCFIAIVFGVWSWTAIIFGDFLCFVSGLWQMAAGFFVIICEAPRCLCVDFVLSWFEWVHKRPSWNRPLAYIVLAIAPTIICPGGSTVLGSLIIFIIGVVYGIIALCRMATGEKKRSVAQQQSVDTKDPLALPEKDKKGSSEICHI